MKDNLLWKRIFVLSRGAMVVFATAPANAPDKRFVIIGRHVESWQEKI